MKIDKTQFIETFRNLPGIIKSYIGNIPGDHLDIKRNKETWTIREHIYHIADVQEMLYNRMLKIKDDEYPEITPYFPDKEQGNAAKFESIEHAFTVYNDYREKQIEFINNLSDQEYLKKADHAEYNHYNLWILINHMIFHDYWHMYRIEEIWLTKDEYFQ